MKNMKMLFFSSDTTEVEVVSKEFIQASIPCEIRKSSAEKSQSGPQQAELWIQDDKDCHRALMLCVHLGIGFSKRPPRPPQFLEDIEYLEEQHLAS
jgi:hypothetical protein